MYNMNRDTYTCDFCGIEMNWENTDDVHGDLWECEVCGNTFCSKCFIDREGYKAYMNMMQSWDKICCPVCYKELFEKRCQ